MLGNTLERRYLHFHWIDVLSVFKVIRYVNNISWSCSGVFSANLKIIIHLWSVYLAGFDHVLCCSLEVSFVSNVEIIPRTELNRLGSKTLLMVYMVHIITSKYDLRNCCFCFSMQGVLYLFFLLMLSLALGLGAKEDQPTKYESSLDRFRGFCEIMSILFSVWYLGLEFEQCVR